MPLKNSQYENMRLWRIKFAVKFKKTKQLSFDEGEVLMFGVLASSLHIG